MRTSDVMAPEATRMSLPDRIVANYAPTSLWVAEAPDVLGQTTLVHWRDHAGSTPCTTISGTAPTYSASDSNFAGRPAVAFSGGYIHTTATFADVDFCLLVVFRDASPTGNYEVLVDLNYANNAWVGRNAGAASSWTAGIIEPGAPYGQVVSATDGAAPHALFLRRSGTTHDVWVDGKQAATKAGSGSACTAATLKIGGGPSGTSGAVSIALVAKWASAPSDASLKAITRIMRAHYMIGEEP